MPKKAGLLIPLFFDNSCIRPKTCYNQIKNNSGTDTILPDATATRRSDDRRCGCSGFLFFDPAECWDEVQVLTGQFLTVDTIPARTQNINNWDNNPS